MAAMFYLCVGSAHNTPLESALENCNIDMVGSLLKAGATITKDALNLLVLDCGDSIVNLVLRYINKYNE